MNTLGDKLEEQHNIPEILGFFRVVLLFFYILGVLGGEEPGILEMLY